MTLHLKTSTKTDKGLVRTNNEDAFFSCDLVDENESDPSIGHLYVVADGMGGVAAGEIASQLATEAMADFYSNKKDTTDGHDLQERLAGAVMQANDSILDYVKQNPKTLGMGTTLTAILFHGDEAILAHVGDSRVYLLRDGDLYQVSKDHSEVQFMVDMGRLTPEEARNHPRKHILTQAVGVENSNFLDIFTRRLSVLPDDVFMMCSDGLTDMLSDDDILDLMMQKSEPDGIAQSLIDAALKEGGRDNVTVIIIRVMDNDA